MKFTFKNLNRRRGNPRKNAGFTLVEFLVAMAMFLVVGGSVLALFAQHAPYFTRQQNLAAVNIAMQNAVAQMQLDLANAGTGYYPGAVISSWPIGVTIRNQPSGQGACNVAATYTYTATCFDTLNILTINPNVQPAHPTDSTGNTASGTCSNIASSPFYIQPNSGQTPTQTAAGFNTGDQVLLITTGGGTHGVQGPTGGNTSTASSGTLVNSFVLSGPPQVGANFVALPFAPASGGNLWTNDPLSISDSDSTNLGAAFCTADWVMKLEPTTYQIDVSNPQDPKLTRTFGSNAPDTIAEQIIGFKVGAAIWLPQQSTSSLTYSFYGQNLSSATPAGYGKNFELVRSVRVTMIGRTTPNPDPTYTFRNTFDGGPYQVIDASVVINPRNLTMNNN
jgi:prepilin-type N-terminal cleavage/methylation domain-containing protein